MLTDTTFRHSLEKLCDTPEAKKFLLAVSGGVDSMVLLHLFSQQALQFEVAHVNYNLRGGDSEKDSDLVRGYCQEKNIPYHQQTVNSAGEKPRNVQLWAREIRYTFFKNILVQESLDFIVTAHHLNDELETFLINLSRASGLEGLSGIPKNEGQVLRPLLSFTKEEICGCAKKNNVPFREDASNATDNYLRNRLRNHAVPELQKTENFLSNFSTSIGHLQDAQQFIKAEISRIENELCTKRGDVIVLNKKDFLSQSPFVQFQILKKYGFSSAYEIAKIRGAETGKIFKGKNALLTVDYKTLNIESGSKNFSDTTFRVTIKNQKIILPEEILAGFQKTGKTFRFRAEELGATVLVRRPRTEDCLRRGEKNRRIKVSKFFKDEKIPILARQKTWVLQREDGEILAVLPFLQDQRFCAKDSGEKVVTLQI